jgi:MYXO-CTERM domain-containing protein
LLALSPCAEAGDIQEPAALEFPIGPVDGGSMVVHEDGVVRITFLGSDAGYFNELYLESDDPSTSDRLLFDRTTRYGRSFVLGNFDAGTILTFRLHVRNTGDDFFTGDASTNPDGIAHARATTVYDAGLDLPVTTVGFEDLVGGGDRDFNDFMFRLTNVVDPAPAPAPVPEPHGLALAGLGLALLALRRRRVRS